MTAIELSLDVLLVEDNPGDAQLVQHHLDAPQVRELAGDVRVSHEESLTTGLRAIDQQSYDTLFLDLGLPESAGLATLERALEAVPEIPIVVLTGLDDRETAVQAIQHGAQDYLPKDDLDPDTLARTLRYAVERHQQEQELRRQNERLDKFVSVVSHDLRNPLNVAQGRFEMIQTDPDREHAETVDRALTRMETLIDDLLTLARQGEAVDSMEVVAISPLVRESWNNIESGAADVNCNGVGAVYAKENRMKQLLENLFRNAIEHNDTQITITVGGDQENQRLYIEDDGAGIRPDESDKIFEHGYSTLSEGTGFGLMIVDEIVNAHGWSISVTQSKTGGARFEITDVEFAERSI